MFCTRRHILTFIMLALTLCFCSCGIKKHVEVKRYHEPTDSVRIVFSRKRMPKGVKRIGTVRVDNCGLTRARNCTFDACLNAIRDAAGEAGADVVRIYYIQKPNRLAYIGLSYLIDGGITRCTAVVKGYMYIRKDKTIQETE